MEATIMPEPTVRPEVSITWFAESDGVAEFWVLAIRLEPNVVKVFVSDLRQLDELGIALSRELFLVPRGRSELPDSRDR